MDPFVLLDDARRGSATLLTGLRRVDPVTLESLDETLRHGWAEGLHAFAWLPYDLGEAHAGLRDTAPGAVYWFQDRAAADPVDVLPDDGHAWLADVAHDVDRAHFGVAVADLQEVIAAGTSYQINYTHQVTGRLVGDPMALYARLRRRQPAAYGALARLPAPAAPWTLSLSPELFIRVADGSAVARPMKGTAPAWTDPVALREDPKNRAENLMIVDLLRNDLSRVAVPGTVAVSRLFEVERVGDLWQMTSTVSGRLVPGTTPADLLAATFPCGSITGAPKLASMRLIRRAERDGRGLYTGSLGLIDPATDELGWAMNLSIAIRTLEVDGEGRVRLGIGSGVVADSTPDGEWAECLAKAAFATGLRPTVTLKETLRVVDGVAPLGTRHQARLTASARELGFGPVEAVVEAAVRDTPTGAWRVAIDVAPTGAASVTRTPLEPPLSQVRLRLAEAPWVPGPLARYKTSARGLYDDAVRAASAAGAFDTIGFDAHGRILEGGRTSVFALLDGRWVTPPLDLGILDGVQRSAVLSDPALLGAGSVAEYPLTLAELRRADAIAVTNAVRGIVAARLEESP
ncbi:bifunctional anthranilate synthase component I family protein/class IV aminotransferase [Tessaracoccus sp. MC1627]|uniref:chorismate-binding protein n=1 Tax=Tessaracoccus sp. MC1627 TaxID=2760312 RepID=UPI0016007E75|nr:bifunctional anthranilate synthase component I family protein/class IV aminotransferase [Tessaracoccus sp. MC1627]MBB1513078.1 bifunctional anthranilate synthase component I family protein/class IV aminotransferase [Tessaracoccus sp. MC1627]